MRFELTRFGGFAGLPRPATIVDTNDLPASSAAELEWLVQSAQFWQLPFDVTSKPPLPDAVSYELTLRDGDRVHAVTFDSASGPADLLALASALRAAARSDDGRP